jgi:succinate--hydroxymethylglutarate CoA-transferase
LCDKLGKPEWKTDERFVTNAGRVKCRVELENMIENVTKTKTTQEWLQVFDESGMPYAAVNDIQDTLNHEHSITTQYPNNSMQELTRFRSSSTRHGQGG